MCVGRGRGRGGVMLSMWVHVRVFTIRICVCVRVKRCELVSFHLINKVQCGEKQITAAQCMENISTTTNKGDVWRCISAVVF